MRIVMSDTPPFVLDLDAPTLPAEAAACPQTGRLLWRVWCRYCRAWHWHGPGEGHRLAHCTIATPYTKTGYNLALQTRGE